MKAKAEGQVFRIAESVGSEATGMLRGLKGVQAIIIVYDKQDRAVRATCEADESVDWDAVSSRLKSLSEELRTLSRSPK